MKIEEQPYDVSPFMVGTETLNAPVMTPSMSYPERGRGCELVDCRFTSV